ncbi:PepSY domain-containing protein, partial [Vibrio parahaemolyticus]|nr:PepSY domain-containing protein [Vibrio parahaemolyticus]EJG1721944.1 PepSY domain-containing protein [Vibrio parahaemolyticus]EJG1763526.1 PepSY domain-containing protein [Vibrio parahaemolyticus]ELB2017160.1 PepSY domain-containing protein [Vibrio parahaemolyticus]
YELYGYDKDGKRAEIYYNPVDMSVVEENDED